MRTTVVQLPTSLVARYRAVDRELVGSALVDTPSHLDHLATDIGRRGILVPLDLRFNRLFATLDGNHRIAVALRLGLDYVPVVLHQLPERPRPDHAKPMAAADHRVLIGAGESMQR
ncbi:ParB N-terminal domain-containing protein [Brachybacterium sp. YJGR34]|uniref:ParB N-terminal domain-containing protein n=1 Tax=Brachybacterium sp. YJGR34 TaxID=2059911 RepID=UPI000E0B8B79|nr:ParB N-terminal domain-containing protein [Brachybacterium sp. YJGR34]